MYSTLIVLAGISVGAWVYLTLFHGRFWWADQRLDEAGDADNRANPRPQVVAVIPARNEEDVIERAVVSLLDQDYPGRFSIVVVDDRSDDATGEMVRRAAARHEHGGRLRIVRAKDMPMGWVGKMWAVQTGVAMASQLAPEAEYLLLTDADVAHDVGNLQRLVTKAEGERLDLVSLMVRLHCESGWERLLIPAFVYFFQKLYPFPRVNNPASATSGAAGGCMLVRAEALKRAGGIEAIRSEVIDDCALGKALKKGGRVWIGVTDLEESFRPYAGLWDIWNMVARSAYTQLHYSIFILVGTIAGLLLTYLVPPLLTLGAPFHTNYLAAALAATAWLLMAITFLPTLRLYRLSPLRALTLPFAGLLYLCMTVDSARRHWQGTGASWKGRAGAGNTQAAFGRTKEEL
jgi:hopene-associated glycosyltransferase HpnB